MQVTDKDQYEELYRTYQLSDEGTPEKMEALVDLCKMLLTHLEKQEEYINDVKEVFANVLTKVQDQKVLKPEEYGYVEKLTNNLYSLVQQLRRLRAGLSGQTSL